MNELIATGFAIAIGSVGLCITFATIGIARLIARVILKLTED